MGTNRRAYKMNQVFLDTKTLLHFCGHKLCVLQTIPMANKENFIVVRTNAFLHHIDKTNQ